MDNISQQEGTDNLPGGSDRKKYNIEVEPHELILLISSMYTYMGVTEEYLKLAGDEVEVEEKEAASVILDDLRSLSKKVIQLL